MTTATAKREERTEAIEKLRQWLKPGDTVYTILRHVSDSGMSRDISVVTLDDGPRPLTHPNWAVAKALGRRLVTRNGYDAIRVSGAGMDMGFELVYSLGRVLWPNGTPEPHGTRNGEPDSDGGYALKQEWL